MVLGELKQFFSSNGMMYNESKNESEWKQLKQFLVSDGHKVGSIRCGSCRRKMLQILSTYK